VNDIQPTPFIRRYNPETDYPGVLGVLTEANMLDPDRDTQVLLARYPESIVVADLTREGSPSPEIVGNVYATRGIMPIVYRLAVRRQWRNRGVGALLLSGAMEILARDGHPDVGVFVDVNDEDVRGWYARRGFTEGGAYIEMWRHM
jgi:ribosomal protein S18 acetylase RimI-like enzyme